MFERGEIVDVEPFPIFPTRWNGHLGDEGIAKCLDIFFLRTSLIDKLDKYRSWVDLNKFSDHYHIICQIEIQDVFVKDPSNLVMGG